ncbi:MAG TPA: antitoxin [Thermoanaerobaculia bacterium]
MKTTLELPDDVVRAVKIRAVQENMKLKDMIADLLRRGLAQEPRVPTAVRSRVKLPLVECAHEARPGEEVTPERAADVLVDEEAGWHRDAVR